VKLLYSPFDSDTTYNNFALPRGWVWTTEFNNHTVYFGYSLDPCLESYPDRYFWMICPGCERMKFAAPDSSSFSVRCPVCNCEVSGRCEVQHDELKVPHVRFILHYYSITRPDNVTLRIGPIEPGDEKLAIDEAQQILNGR
jgi:hypothetical protein